VQQEIADYLGMPAVAVQEVATFYNMYNTSRWASTRSPSAPTCRVAVGRRARCPSPEASWASINETTADGQFTLMEGECMGACGDAPVMLVNNHQMCSWMSNEKIDALLEELKK
jgi:NADH-quinone oxidoreductase subunit E